MYDNTVVIHNIVREPGYRTKIAVYSNRDDVDPVGACVGMKGVRIQAIVSELEGEKIDILKYETDPYIFIKNALSPAQVTHVVILDHAKRQAMAVVPEQQLSLAIGKQGLNVRLANRLVDWNIDVKTEAQFEEMEFSADARQAVSDLFDNGDDETEISSVAELPGLDERLVNILKENGIELIETLVSLSRDELKELQGITEADIEEITRAIDENVEIIDDEDSEAESYSEETVAETESEEDEEDVYLCPECGAEINTEMSACPSCGVGLSFEVEEDDDGEEE